MSWRQLLQWMRNGRGQSRECKRGGGRGCLPSENTRNSVTTTSAGLWEKRKGKFFRNRISRRYLTHSAETPERLHGKSEADVVKAMWSSAPLDLINKPAQEEKGSCGGGEGSTVVPFVKADWRLCPPRPPRAASLPLLYLFTHFANSLSEAPWSV